ncbi:hypothetical protein E2C01_061588 [Portunus trituberculatus]|uniref:Uncharacterized protein n=1 Tax=Portunus trituberculatus TaxID=210409 RepID=A0A5B7HBD9_PORTR|nr:hypothetical protein [Portunus trituberculatus]
MLLKTHPFQVLNGLDNSSNDSDDNAKTSSYVEKECRKLFNSGVDKIVSGQKEDKAAACT